MRKGIMVAREAATHGSTQPSSVLVHLRGLLPELTGMLRRIGETILEDPSAAVHLTIVELADRSGTSPATVTRFCRAVGFGGYGELRLGLAAELGSANQPSWEEALGPNIGPDDDLDRVMRVITTTDTAAIQETAAQLDLGKVDQVATAIAAARRVDLYGVGGSATMASEFQLRLHRLGVSSWAWAEAHSALTSAALLGSDDVVVGISHGGRTRETIEMLEQAGSRGATTVALTNFPRSPITDVADVVLTTAVRETSFRPGPLAALHCQLVVLDLVYVAVAQRTYTRTAEAFALTTRAIEPHRIPTDE